MRDGHCRGSRPPGRRRGLARLGAAIFAALLAAAPGIGVAQQDATAPRPAPIDRNGTLILIRSSLLALQQANETGNYTVLRDLAAPAFQQTNTAARLGELFASQRAQKLDLSGAAVLDPQLTILPQIEPNGFLRIAGFFPSIPAQINFELLYAPVEGRWRLFGISVGLRSATPAAPPPVAAVRPPPAPRTEPRRLVKPPPRRRPSPPQDGNGNP